MATADQPGAVLMLVPESLIWPDRNDHTYLVIHKTASGGSAQDIATYFAGQQNTGGASVHYIIGQDGAIVQCVLEKDAAGGNCCTEAGHATFLPDWDGKIDNGNWHSVSIEHCDPALDNSTPLTPAQKASSFALVKAICGRHNIPLRRATNDGLGGIIGHNDIAPESRAHCPGNYPWDDLWAFLQQGATTMVPQGWQDDGTTLTAPNGHKVVRGFRDYILSHAWAPDDQPQGEEFAANPVEYSNPGLGGGTKQCFNRTVLEWTASRGVFVAWPGQEIYALLQQLAQAKSAQIPPVAIADLQAAFASISKVLTDFGIKA